MVYCFYISPAFFKVLNAPFLFIVFIAWVEIVRVKVLFNSGTNILFFCKLGWRLSFPPGLN